MAQSGRVLVAPGNPPSGEDAPIYEPAEHPGLVFDAAAASLYHVRVLPPTRIVGRDVSSSIDQVVGAYRKAFPTDPFSSRIYAMRLDLSVPEVGRSDSVTLTNCTLGLAFMHLGLSPVIVRLEDALSPEGASYLLDNCRQIAIAVPYEVAKRLFGSAVDRSEDLIDWFVARGCLGYPYLTSAKYGRDVGDLVVISGVGREVDIAETVLDEALDQRSQSELAAKTEQSTEKRSREDCITFMQQRAGDVVWTNVNLAAALHEMRAACGGLRYRPQRDFDWGYVQLSGAELRMRLVAELRGATLGEALSILGQVYGMKLWIVRHNVVFVPYDWETGNPWEFAAYRLREETVKAVEKEMGVSFSTVEWPRWCAKRGSLLDPATIVRVSQDGVLLICGSTREHRSVRSLLALRQRTATRGKRSLGGGEVP